MPTSASELHALLSLPALAGVPLLVLANKSDLPEAMAVDDMIREMRLAQIGGRVVSVSSAAAGYDHADNPVLLHKQQDQA